LLLLSGHDLSVGCRRRGLVRRGRTAV